MSEKEPCVVVSAAPTPLAVLIRGAPGVGKSTVAGLLADRGAVGAECEVDGFRAMLAGVDWRDRSQHALAMDATIRAAGAFLFGGRSPVVVVDTFGRDAALRAAASLRAAGIVVRVCTLWAEEGVLMERLRGRVGGYADEEMARLLNEEVRETRVGDELFDTTALLPGDVVDRMIAFFGDVHG